MKAIISITRLRSLREKSVLNFAKKLGWEDEERQPEGREALTVYPKSKGGNELLMMEEEASLKRSGVNHLWEERSGSS